MQSSGFLRGPAHARRMRSLPSELQTLSQTQSGLLTAIQLRKHGFRRRDIDVRIARGDWQRVSATVVAVHNQPLDRAAQLWAAALHFERCGLGGQSALELLGLPVPVDQRIHVIGPRAGWYSPMPLVVPHTSTACEFSTGEPLHVDADLAVLQALRWAFSSAQSVHFSTWALQRGIVTIESLQARASQLKRSPGSGRMRERLAIVEPGVHSYNEFVFAQECRRRGLPEPIRQRRRTDGFGRDRYLDAEFEVNGHRVCVEIDGRQHLGTVQRMDDDLRANEIMIQGVPVLKVTSVALRLNSEPFFQQLQRLLSRWRRAA